jgi:glutamate-1-semialdehyde 2,1-aminomutase
VSYTSRLQRVIPGGAHTYSKGSDQFPSNAPQIFERGEGVYLFDPDGKKFLDFGMGLRSVLIGYAEEQINTKAIEYLKKGMNLTRPSMIELEAAELMTDLIPTADMVKFTKNGSTAVTAAVKLSRAYTGRKKIAICADHPFFSYDDWFIGTTPMSKGVLEEHSEFTMAFKYNDITSLEKIISENINEIACVLLEPLAVDCPSTPQAQGGCCGQKKCSRAKKDSNDSFLHKVQELCKKNGIVFILDEMITGFRWGLAGAQGKFNLNPDLSTFGKAMANGFPLACVVGKREIMSQGSIEELGKERLFLISTTHGADMASMGAFVANVDFMKREPVEERVWDFGSQLITKMNQCAVNRGLEKYFQVFGPACSPRYVTFDSNEKTSLEFRTLFVQEMLKRGILMPWISISYRHTESLLSEIEQALDETFQIYAQALETSPKDFVQGDYLKPVFRQFN